MVTLLVQLALGGVRARARVPFSVNSRAGPAPYAGYHVRLPKFMHGTPARTPGADRYGACVFHVWSFCWCVLCNITCIANTYKKTYKKRNYFIQWCVVLLTAPRVVSVAVGTRRAERASI